MSWNERFHIANVRLDAATEAAIVQQVSAWCRETNHRARTVCFVNAYSVVAASKDREMLEAINGADMSVADGVPVAWLGRRLSGLPCERLSGPDLMHHLLTASEHRKIRHFVYGGDQSSLERLEFRYNRGGTRIPRPIVGTYSPPYRELTSEEETHLVSRLDSLKPDIVWVCLGTGKQEKWMARMRDRVRVPVLAGVGAAVDFLSGGKPRAPRWMQRVGMEWSFRLATEPTRLWRRYLLGNVIFLGLAGVELFQQTPRRNRA